MTASPPEELLQRPELAELDGGHVTPKPVASGAAIFEAGTQPRAPGAGSGGEGGCYQDSRWPPCLLASPLARAPARRHETRGRLASARRAGRRSAARGPGRSVRPPSCRGQSVRGAGSPGAARARGV